MMFIIVFPKFFTRPQKPVEDSQNSHQSSKEIRLAKFGTILREHAPYLLGWSSNDSKTSRYNGKTNEGPVSLPPYTQDPEISTFVNGGKPKDL